MNGNELVASITAFAIATAGCFTREELNILAISLTQLGDTYATLALTRPDTQTTEHS